MAHKTYSTKSNANRAANGLRSKLADDFTVGEPIKAGTRWTFEIVTTRHEVELTPEERELLAPFAVTHPAAPTPDDAVAHHNIKPFDQWEKSSVETPCAVCAEVFMHHLEQGSIDERKEILNDLVSLGVHRNTAATQYRRFRIRNGLPGAVHRGS